MEEAPKRRYQNRLECSLGNLVGIPKQADPRRRQV